MWVDICVDRKGGAPFLTLDCIGERCRCWEPVASVGAAVLRAEVYRDGTLRGRDVAVEHQNLYPMADCDQPVAAA